jgi:ABC-2 type transport system permease protein
MRQLGAALATELLKSRRSKVPWTIAASFSLAPLVGGLFMFIIADPERATQFGLLGTKAQLRGAAADWPTYLGLLAQSLAVGGGILFAFLAAWVFGREFTDHTVQTLLAVATPRWALVAAKCIVVFAWGAATAVWGIVLGFAVGVLIGLPGWSGDVARDMIAVMSGVAVMIVGLQTTTAFVASAGRGYLPPLAWAVLTIFLAQILSVLGWGAWFPWAVPALLSGAAGPEGETVTTVNFILVAAACVAGWVATTAWWERADQTG